MSRENARFSRVRCAWLWGGSLSAAYVARPAVGVIGIENRVRRLKVLGVEVFEVFEVRNCCMIVLWTVCPKRVEWDM